MASGRGGEISRGVRNSLLMAAVLVYAPVMVCADDFPPVFNSPAEADQSPWSAEQAAAGIQVPAGFGIDVFAAEPDVQNPIAMCWDARGRMWVAENFTYAEKTQRFELSLRDRVLILEDSDHDGRADRRSVFCDDVQMLTSVALGHGGVWLMCPPQLLFIPDADGDDVPDGPPQVMLDGFTVAKSNYHNFANGLRWGPDGWLYGRCGHSCPGQLGVPGTSAAERIPMDGGIWRYHPFHRRVEVICHGTVNPWGHDWDAHGELFFINTVIGHLWQALPGAHFQESSGVSENPDVFERLGMIADHYHFDTRGSWTESRDGRANSLGGGHAHSGMTIYQGTSWPAAYQHRLFTLNMHGKRANVERLEREGAGYVGRHEPDLLIAADPFFRGVEIRVGPDEQMYVLDWSDTGECHEHSGVHRTSGRVFRIRYGEAAVPQRLRREPYCAEGDGPLPQLWRQYRNGLLTPALWQRALASPDEHLRVWGIRLATDLWPLDTLHGPGPQVMTEVDRDLVAQFTALARHDESGLVLSALASTLQRLPVGQRRELAAALVARSEYASDRDLPLLTWYGVMPLADAAPADLISLARASRWPQLTRWITRALARRMESQPAALEQLLAEAVAMPVGAQQEILQGMAEALKGWSDPRVPQHWAAFVTCEAAKQEPDLVLELSCQFGDPAAIAELREIALNEGAALSRRSRALASWLTVRAPQWQDVCEQLLSVPGLNLTAARGLARQNSESVAQLILEHAADFQPSDRPAMLEILVSRANFARVLLTAMEADPSPIAAAELPVSLARQIQQFRDAELDARLARVWGELRSSPAERKAQMATLRSTLTPEELQRADLAAGRLLFDKSCASCHVLYDSGRRVGPDLTGSQRGNLDYLLENILDPSAVVGKDYRMKIVVTTDGRVLNGMVIGQNDQTLTLQTATEQLTLATSDVLEISETTLSPMPDGLLSPLEARQIRDLFAYLMHTSQVELPSGTAAGTAP